MKIKALMKWLAIAFGVLLVFTSAVVVYYWDIAREVVRQQHMFSAPHFDTTAPLIPEFRSDKPVILSFSKTNGFRHYDTIDASNIMLESIADENSWQLYKTENNNVFDWVHLRKFDLVVLNNSSGDLYTVSQRAAFKRYIEEGGTVIALHAAGGDLSYDWQWYGKELIRAQFVAHPMHQHIQKAKLLVNKQSHSLVSHLPLNWFREDEWYNFEFSPSDRVNVLLSIDESTYDPETSPMGEDHPLVWLHNVGKGKIFYSALGHTAETYSELQYIELITNAIYWGLDIND